MNIVRKSMAWLLVVTMLVTSVDYVHAVEAVDEETITTEVSQGDSSAVSVSEDSIPVMDENTIPGEEDVEENATEDGTDVSDGDILYSVAVVSDGDILYSGTETGITWSITSDGLLTIGGTYDAESEEAVECSWRDYSEEIKKAVVTAENVRSTAGWFAGCYYLTEIDCSNFDTSNVENMAEMFYRCHSLTKLDVSGFNTSKVTDMSDMFNECSSLSSLDVGGFDTGRVTDMSGMFRSCSSLSSLDVGGFDTGRVTDMSGMFRSCSGLSSLDVSGFDTSRVTDMSDMFCFCNGLSSLDVSGFDTSRVTDMSDMFHSCTGLPALDVSGFDTSNVTDMSNAFMYCLGLSSLDVSGFDTSNVTDMSSMFYMGLPSIHGSSLTSLDVSGFDTSKVTDMSYMFEGLNSLTGLDVSGFDTSKVTNMTHMFGECSGLSSLNVSGIDTGNVTNMAYMFEECSGLSSLDVSGFNTGKVTNMTRMFGNCSGLSSLDVSALNTENVTDMTGVFFGCSSLMQLDLSRWDTSNVTIMLDMFYGCSGLEKLNISSFDTARVTNMSGMFGYCSSLVDLDVGSLNTGNVTAGMRDMFSGCSSLSSLDLSGFDTTQVQDMSRMFSGCSSLISLDLSVFDTSNLQSAQDMLEDCDGLIEFKCMPELQVDISVPKILYDADSNMYDTNLPRNLTEGIWLYAGCNQRGEVSGLEWFLSEDGVLIITGKYDATAAVEGTELPWHAYASNIKKVVVNARDVESAAYWFDGCYMLREANLGGFDTSKVTNMKAMFRGCSSLTVLDVSRFDMGKVTNVEDMFLGCLFNRIKVFKNLNISIVLSECMFVLEGDDYIEYKEFPQNVKEDLWLYSPYRSGEMDGLRWYYFNDGRLYITGENTNTEISGETTEYPWHNYANVCSRVVVDAEGVISTAHWFEDFTGIEEIDLSKFNAAALKDTTDMLKGCTNLEKLKTFKNLSVSVTLPFTMYDDRAGAYAECPLNVTEDLWLYKRETAGEIQGIGWVLLQDGTLMIGGTDTSTTVSTATTWPWHEHKDKILRAKIYAKNVKSTRYWFDGLSKLETVDFSSFDTSQVSDMSVMFRNCSSLKTLDLGNFDTAQVTSMRAMFNNCEALTTLNIGNFDTSKVIDMAYMFYGCKSLQSLNVSTWNTASATDMTAMFTNCAKLTELDLSRFDLKGVSNVSKMLDGCTGIKTLNTPLNLKLDAALPTGMVGADWNVYTMLPKNKAESVVLDARQVLASGVYCGMNWAVLKDGRLLITGTYSDALKTDTSWQQYAANIKSVRVTAAGVKSTKYWFDGLSKLETVDFSSFDTSQVSDMSVMFRNCSGLKTLDLGNFDTAQVTSMRAMFNNCEALTTLNIGNFDTSKVIDMAYMFYGCKSLQSLNVSTWNTASATDMTAMFTNCTKLTELDLSRFDLRGVSNVSKMLDGCTGIKTLNTPLNLKLDAALPTGMVDADWNVYTRLPRNKAESVVLDARQVLASGVYCGMNWAVLKDGRLLITGTYSEVLETDTSWQRYAANIKSVRVTAAGVKSTRDWFNGLSNLETVDFSDFDTSQVTDMTGMFRGCSKLFELDLSSFDMTRVTTATKLLDGCTGIEKIYTPRNLKLDVALPLGMVDADLNAYTALPMNKSDSVILEAVVALGVYCGMDWVILKDGRLIISGNCTEAADTDTTWLEHAEVIKSVRVTAAGVKSTSDWFNGLSNLETVDFSNFDTSQVTDMTGMFQGCSGLKTLDLGNFETAQVTSMRAMFNNCEALASLNISKFDTSKVTDMAYMFYGCKSLQGLDVSTWNTASATDMTGMFRGCSKLNKLNLSAWDVSKVVSAEGMFTGCTGLSEIKVFQNLKTAIDLPHAMYDLQAVEYLQFPCDEQSGKVLYKFPYAGNAKGITWIIHGGTLVLNGDAAEAAGITQWPWLEYADLIYQAVVYTKNVQSTACWFDGCMNLTQVNVSELNFSNITDMSYMFRGCSGLTTLDISGFDTAKVTKMTEMFKDCVGLTKMDMVHFDLSMVTDAKNMLSGCSGIGEIRMPANLTVDIGVPKTLYNYLGEPLTKSFPKYQSEAEWYYAVSPVNEGELHVSKVYPQNYTGKSIKPEIRVYDGATRLVEKKDYTVTYKNNKKANDATDAKKAPTIIVKGRGNYTKTETITFPILAKDISAEDVTVQELVAVEGKKIQKPVPRFTYNGKKLVKGKDFTVSYPDLENKSNPNAYKVAGTYRVVVAGIGNYTGTRELLFTITDGALMSKVKVSKIPAQQYNAGKAVEPAFKVTYKKTELVAGKDYTVAYKNNKEIGKASVILTGKGDYAGTKTVTFQIVGQSIAKASVSGIENKVYTGQAQTQNVKVALAGKTLKAGTDYTVSYSKNVDAGTATVTVTGKGAYSGTVKKTFKITPYDLETNKKLFAGVPKNLKVAYEKGGNTPSVNLTFAGADMIVKKDYTISYANNKKVADAKAEKAPTITIKGKGNFKGKVTIPFTIAARDWQNAENPLTIRVPDMAYSAKAGMYISKPVLTDSNGKKLVAGTDYEKEIVYTLEDGTALDKKSVVEAGKTIKVKITAKGNYTGTMEATYKITKASFKSAKIKIEPQVYTGKGVTVSKDDIVVKMGGDALTYGVDYEIVEDSYKNNVKKGTASVTIKGLGNYGGEKTVKFKIVPKELIWFWRLFS